MDENLMDEYCSEIEKPYLKSELYEEEEKKPPREIEKQ